MDRKRKECSCSCCHGENHEVAALPIKEPAANPNTTDVFRIEGMDCADCAAKLEKKINALAGVQAATVNFGAGKLAVEHSLTAAEIIKVIEQAGYQAFKDGLNRRADTSTTSWWRKPKTLATILSGAFLDYGRQPFKGSVAIFKAIFVVVGFKIIYIEVEHKMGQP